MLDGSNEILEASLFEGKCLFQGSKFILQEMNPDNLSLPAHSILKLKVRS